MPSLFLLLFAVTASGVWAVWRRGFAPTSRFEAIAFLVMWCFTLGLALRFGGRTYPGIFFPNSSLLNDVFNGVGLFVQAGYDAVAICFVAELAPLVLPVGRRAASYLNAISWLAFTTATLIATYGFYWAAVLGRLP
jgi:hypothetical protein